MAISCYKLAMLNKNIMTALVGMAVLAAPAVAADFHRMELTVGQKVEIVLPGNPTTGYMWSVAETTPAVKVELELMENKSPRGMVGALCETVVTVTAVQAGQGEVKLVYARPWEKGKAPADTCHINVSVK